MNINKIICVIKHKVITKTEDSNVAVSSTNNI